MVVLERLYRTFWKTRRMSVATLDGQQEHSHLFSVAVMVAGCIDNARKQPAATPPLAGARRGLVRQRGVAYVVLALDVGPQVGRADRLVEQLGSGGEPGGRVGVDHRALDERQ